MAATIGKSRQPATMANYSSIWSNGGRAGTVAVAPRRRAEPLHLAILPDPDDWDMPRPDLSILIIDENRIRASIIEEGLREAGHGQVAIIHDVNEVGRTIERVR